jgi:hypothetical protein
MESNFERSKIGKKEPDLEIFHKEIRGLKEAEEEEMRKKEAEGSTGSVHLRGLNPEELTMEDAAIYEKFKKLELTKEEYGKWREDVVKDVEARAPQGPVGSPGRLEFFDKDSRHIFMQYITNKIGLWENWSEKKEKFNLFCEEISRLKDEEIKKMEEKKEYDPHLATILNIRKLTPRDMEIFEKFKKGLLKENSEEFLEYRREIFRECQEHFRQELVKHKRLEEFIKKSAGEEAAIPLELEAYMRFQSIFSRTNFLAWLHNKMFEVALQESRARRQNKRKDTDA